MAIIIISGKARVGGDFDGDFRNNRPFTGYNQGDIFQYNERTEVVRLNQKKRIKTLRAIYEGVVFDDLEEHMNPAML